MTTVVGRIVLPGRHKLSPITTRPFEVIEMNSETIVVKREDEVERLSRERVVLAPRKPTNAKTKERVVNGKVLNGRSPEGEICLLPLDDQRLADVPVT